MHVDDVPLHIVQRGHNRAPCFFSDSDYGMYLHCLGDALRDAQCALHAYVLMTNHVHLLVTPRDASLVPRLAIALGRKFVQRINAAYGRTGTLWDRRYHSSLVESDTYLLACMRYIEQNPVRAGIVRDPAEYRWSSYEANARGGMDPLLTAHQTYAALGSGSAARGAAYRALFRDAPDPDPVADIRTALVRGNPLGSESFVAMIERALGRSCVARAPGRPRGPDSQCSEGGQFRGKSSASR